jgi:hypothetical protein
VLLRIDGRQQRVVHLADRALQCLLIAGERLALLFKAPALGAHQVRCIVDPLIQSVDAVSATHVEIGVTDRHAASTVGRIRDGCVAGLRQQRAGAEHQTGRKQGSEARSIPHGGSPSVAATEVSSAWMHLRGKRVARARDKTQRLP